MFISIVQALIALPKIGGLIKEAVISIVSFYSKMERARVRANIEKAANLAKGVKHEKDPERKKRMALEAAKRIQSAIRG